MTCNPLSWEFSLVSFRYTLYILRRNQFLWLDCLVCACVFCNCNSRCRVPPFPISLLKPKEMEILIYQYIEIPKIRNCKKKVATRFFFDAGGDENLLFFLSSLSTELKKFKSWFKLSLLPLVPSSKSLRVDFNYPHFR